MWRLFAAVLLAALLGDAHLAGSWMAPVPLPPESVTPDDSPTYRVCLKSVQTIASAETSDQPARTAKCAVCELKAASQSTEPGCQDFYTADAAKRYWDSVCCD